MEIYRPIGYQPDDAVPHDGDLNYEAIAPIAVRRFDTQAYANLCGGGSVDRGGNRRPSGR